MVTKPGHRFGEFIRNGIDRKDNDKNYTLENSVPCCWTCNRGKMSKTMDEWQADLNRMAKAAIRRHQAKGRTSKIVGSHHA